MKYQVRIKDIMSDTPASKLLDTYAEAVKVMESVKDEIKRTWATPSGVIVYIFVNDKF